MEREPKDEADHADAEQSLGAFHRMTDANTCRLSQRRAKWDTTAVRALKPNPIK